MTKYVQVRLFNSQQGEEKFRNKGQVNSLKKKHMEIIEEAMFDKGQRITKAHREILGFLVYNTCVTGVQSISLEKLIEKTGFSRRTVIRAKNAFDELDIFTIGYLGDEHKGHYVFVLNIHKNYAIAMEKLFEITTDTNSDTNSDTSSKAETPWESKDEGQEIVSTLYTLNTLKQEKNNKQSFTQDLEEFAVQENLEERTEYMNESQQKLYHSIKAGEYHSLIITEASKIALRVGKEFDHVKAVKAIIKLDRALKSYAEELTSIPATFNYYFEQELTKASNPAPIEEVEEPVRTPIPFFNWLEN